MKADASDLTVEVNGFEIKHAAPAATLTATKLPGGNPTEHTMWWLELRVPLTKTEYDALVSDQLHDAVSRVGG